MPHQIFEIDELLRLVVDELVEISPRSAVSFALTCRFLEEPTLSSLWKEQTSLIELMKVLPQHICIEDKYHLISIAIRGDPPSADWNRLQRYASWMRNLILGWSEVYITNDTLSRLSHNSPDGVLCRNLERLLWQFDISGVPLSFFRLFISSHLKRVTLSTRFHRPAVPPEASALLTEIVLCLPTSLECVSLKCGQGGEPLIDAISSFVCRCGSSLRSFTFAEPLSEAAFNHLMRLPNLRSWTVVNEPPRTLPLTTFPSLQELHLEWAALPWLHLLTPRGDNQLRNGLTSPPAILNTNIKETLKILTCPEYTPINSTLLHSASSFRNLVRLNVRNGYCNREVSCIFRLTDDDVENLAVALPSLVDLRFGRACNFNTCRTSVSSLLSMSIHCPELAILEIHFNTQTIASDMRRLLDDGLGRDKQRCRLRCLLVGYLPLQVGEEDIGTVAMGFADIFPCLKDLSGTGDDRESWKAVGSKLCD